MIEKIISMGNSFFRLFLETSVKLVFVLCVLSGVFTLGLVLTIGYNNDASNAIAMVKKTDIPIYKVQTDKRVCSLTFDCAWTADDIQQIAGILKKENVKASFFVVGLWAQKNPDAIRLLEKEGHDISGHGYTHLKFTALEKGRAREELKNFNKTISSILGKDEWLGKDLFRPPYGDWNKNVVHLAAEEGLYTIQWSADTIDYKPNVTKSFIMQRIKEKLDPGGIILMHNGTKITASVLEEVIQTIKADGYELMPVSELIYRENYRMDSQGTQMQNK